jgi:catechol 2,3-dioxygenase-like lactoylglutathione lyase family enzyme
MQWSMHHAMIPAFDTGRERDFLADVFGMEPVAVESNDDGYSVDQDHLLLYVDAAGRELHVVKPVPSFSSGNGVPLNPTMGHVAINVNDLDLVAERLAAGGWTFGDAGEIGPKGMRRLYLLDPYMNVLEVNERTADA